MKLIFIVGLCIIYTLIGQQPPTDSNVRTWSATRTYTRMEYVTLKTENIALGLEKLRDKLKDSTHLEWSQTAAALHQRGNDTLDDSRALEYSCIIDRENDAIINSELINMKKLVSTISNLEAKLEKQEATSMHRSEKLLNDHDEMVTHVEIALEQEKLFNSMLKLIYQQSIRRHQKASQIRGMLAKLPKP